MDKPVTLITGTSRGIGKYLAHYYVEQGHRIIGCSRSKPQWQLEDYDHIVTDVSDEKAVKAIFAKIRRDYRRLDHLINNAGCASMNHALLTPLSSAQGLMNTNFIATFLFCREAAKLMLTRHRGRIVNFTTVAVPLKLEGEAIYASTKAAVKTLTEVLAREFATYGITVNAIGPTPIATDLIKNVPKEKIDALVNSQAIKRLGQFEDVSNVVDFFLQPKSEFITGQTLFLGGIS